MITVWKSCRILDTASDFALCRPVSAFRALGLVFFVCVILLAAGCTLDDDKLTFCSAENDPHCRDIIDRVFSATTRSNPVELEFRTTSLPPAAESDNQNYRTPEFMGHHALAAISADKAYRRGYFGQSVTIAVADDGMDLTHPDLEGKIRAPRHIVTGTADVVEQPSGAGDGQGTFVALISATKRNNPGETFEIKIDGGTSVPTKNVHGIAPQASIMPLALSGGGQPLDAIRYAVENRAHILNLSIGVNPSISYGKYAGREGVWLLGSYLPYFRPLMLENQCEEAHFSADFFHVAGEIENEDIVLVWAAGNDGWNSFSRFLVPMCGKNFIDEDGCPLGDEQFTKQEFMENFEWILSPEDNPDRTCSLKDMWGTDCGSDSCVEYNSPGGWAEAPLIDSRLLGKWLVVVATDKDGRIADFSNGCGAARNWCLAAPGENIEVTPEPDRGISGTSFAAPMVTGALAVLKSRFPDMSMDLIQSILLVSADPFGTRESNPDEPDPVYGWGRLNLERAVTLAGQVRLPYSVPETE